MYETLEKLTESERELLRQLRESVSDILKPHHDDLYLAKWLKVHCFNKEKAEYSVRKSICEIRKIYSVDTIKEDYVVPEVIEKYGVHAFLGFDKDGCPVRFVPANRSDAKGLLNSVTEEDIIMCLFYFLEVDNDLRLQNNKKNGLWAENNVYILDLEGFPVYEMFSKALVELGLRLLKLYTANYPENVKTAVAFHAPAFAFWLYELGKPLIPPELAQKVKIFGTDGWKEYLLEVVGPEVLPAYLGGILTDPDGNPMCVTMMGQGGEVPKEYYVKNKKRLRPENPDVHSAVIDIKSSLVVEIPVDDTNAVLFWEFQTEKYDIACGLSYKKDAETDDSELQVLLPLKRAKCDELPCEEKFVCEIPGIYVLQFDNSYSWVNQKKLLYKVEVVLPNDVIKTFESEYEVE